MDHAGHSGNWGDYTTAIQKADSIVGLLWDKIQTDPFYQNSTTMFVTNDHGRHDDQHGGFTGHGDGCDGCRHIQFLALGPAIKKNFTDVRSSSNILQKFFLEVNYPNPFNPSTTIRYHIQELSFVTLKVYDVMGSEIATLVNEEKPAGGYNVEFSAIGRSASAGNAFTLPSGIYLYQIKADNYLETKKMVLMK